MRAVEIIYTWTAIIDIDAKFENSLKFEQNCLRATKPNEIIPISKTAGPPKQAKKCSITFSGCS